jgi:hypothetical protein
MRLLEKLKSGVCSDRSSDKIQATILIVSPKLHYVHPSRLEILGEENYRIDRLRNRHFGFKVCVGRGKGDLRELDIGEVLGIILHLVHGQDTERIIEWRRRGVGLGFLKQTDDFDKDVDEVSMGLVLWVGRCRKSAVRSES